MAIHTLSIDVETFSDVDLKKCGVYKYAESPDFEILLFGVSVDGGEVIVKQEFSLYFYVSGHIGFYGNYIIISFAVIYRQRGKPRSHQGVHPLIKDDSRTF